MTDPDQDPETESPAGPARRRQSPGYPAIDLRAAVDRTLDLYKASPRQPVPLAVAAELWGYSAKSSSSKTTAAALKRYGLVRDVGGGDRRQLALTDEGREIAFSDEERGTDRWANLIQDAAVKPKIFRQVVDHFGVPLPDERVVLRHLMFDLGFADEATARDFLHRLRSTLDFAGLAESGARGVRDVDDQMSDESATPTTEYAGPSIPASERVWRVPAGEPAEPHVPVRSPDESVYDAFRAEQQVVQIPYSNGQWAQLRAAFPLTEDEWMMLMGVLQAMKPGLVRTPPSEARPGGETT